MHKSEFELELVTKITHVCREHVSECASDFWSNYAIISPHHAHINKLKERINTELEDYPEFSNRDRMFIGTVDKLQGQEREVVVVSYGVSDVERAVAESEFIYSRNRLNVAMTRGKKKMICILTDALLERPVEALEIDDEETLKGISYMIDFDRFMRRIEDDTECDLHSFSKKYTGDEEDEIIVELMRKRVVG